MRAQRYRVEITKTAESDIREIFQYITTDHKTAAKKQFPVRCPVIPESRELGKEYQHIIYGNYRTIFRIDGTKVIIMRVIHGARLLSLKMF
jgi:toxin ParE1/3/4